MSKYIVAAVVSLFVVVGTSPAWVEGGLAPGPIAYAAIGPDGTVLSGTPNVSCTWDATNSFYRITILGVNYQYYTHVTVATAMYPGMPSVPFTCETASAGGDLVIRIMDPTGAPEQQYFQFVTFQP